jgi:nucleoside-diphosphate-sugar epimerase
MNLIITGSRGRVGTRVMAHARAQGDTVFGVDLPGFGNGEDYMAADLTDFGAVIDAFYAADGADAIIHLGALADSRLVAAPRLFAANMSSTFNVFQAAMTLGIPRVVFASSIQTVRTSHDSQPTRYRYFPLDEAHETDPQNDYALSKDLGERIGEMFARHHGLTVASLRFTWVSMEDELAALPYGEPSADHPALYGYCDVRDVARACRLAALADVPAGSHTRAFVTAPDTWLPVSSAELVRTWFPEAEDRGLQGFDALVSGETARRVFGFVPEFVCQR